MGKSINTDVLDAALDELANGNQITVCSQEPTSRTEAISTYALASTSLSGGDFTKAAGDTSGRKVTVSEKAGINVDDSGTATHIAIVDGSRLLLVTTCISQALTEDNEVTIPAFKYEIRDPS